MLYLITLIKYLIVTTIVSAIGIYCFPNRIAFAIGIIFILSSFSSAKQEINEKKVQNQVKDKEEK